jgi:hypothetical protein
MPDRLGGQTTGDSIDLMPHSSEEKNTRDSFNLMPDWSGRQNARDSINLKLGRSGGQNPRDTFNSNAKRSGKQKPVTPFKHLHHNISRVPRIHMSRDSSVSIATGYGLDDRGSIPGGGWQFFSSTLCPDRLLGPPSLLSKGYQGVFPWG